MDEDNFIAAMIAVTIFLCGNICVYLAYRRARIDDEENGFYNTI